MVDYEKISASEVQRLAKQGDKDALYEMAWRTELMPAGDRNNPVESCAWQDYWFEKAADAGHIDAKSRYARSLIQRVMDKDCRKKAMGYFQSLSDDLDAGKLSGEQREDGALAKFWLGIMLCEGYHTPRDAEKGRKLIESAETFFNGFEGFGYGLMNKIGNLYATGLAQAREEPSIADLEKAIKYLDMAVKRFNPERDDPNNRGYLKLAKDQLETQRKRIVEKSSIGREETVFVGAKERRTKMMEISDAARQRVEADKAALARLRERLAREGWNTKSTVFTTNNETILKSHKEEWDNIKDVGMENIKKHLEQAENKLQQEWQEKEKKNLADIERTKKEITDLAKSEGDDFIFSPFAILDFKNQQLHEEKENQNLPELVRIGKLNPVNYSDKMPEIPMLLPFSEHAVSFSLNENDVHTLFSMIAFRLMLSLPLNLAKFYFVDKNLGRDFALMNKIDRKNVDYSIIANQQEMNRMFSELEQLVTDTYKKHLATFNSLKDYNKTAGEMQEAYRFVFLTNFPAGFTTETAEKLYSFINNGNAAKAGVYIFFSIEANEKPPYGIDMKRFEQSTTCICQKSKNEYKIESPIFTGDFNNKFSIALDKSLPSNVEHIIDLINKKTVTKTVVSFEKRYKERLENKDFWKGSTIDELKIPIGYVKSGEEQYLEFSEKTNNYFGLIGGLPGTGKTVLLHNIIIWGAMEYSPFELKYYLIDCKNGTGFNAYRDLPHTEILSAYNDREYCASLLKRLSDVMTERQNLFKKASAEKGKQIDKIDDYRKETNEQMPRIIAIIDEFQVLFKDDDKIARTIQSRLDEIFRLGRASGISVLLCSQGISNVNYAFAIIKNITWRLAFSLSATESENILRNDQASHLTKKGNALLNTTQSGEKKHNINFQVGMIDDIFPYIEDLNKTFKEKFPDAKIDKFISDGDNSARIERNETLKNNIINNAFKVNDRFCDVYIGEPAFIREEHAKIRIRKQAGSNIILVGSDIKSAISIIGLINYQLIRQSSEQSKFYIIDCFNIDNEYCECFDFAKKYFPSQISIFNAKKIDTVIDEMEAELQHRIDKENEGERVGGRIVLSVAYMQNCRALKKDGYNPSSITKKLVKIIKEGAEYGIHVLLYSLTYQGVTEILDTGVLNEFENRIALDSGKSMGIITEQTGTKISEKGMALLQAPEEFTTYNPDLIRVYSQCNVDEKSDDIEFINQLLKR